MPVNVVQVELVGGTIWDWLLPVAAILVSLFSLGLTLWFRRTDGARIELRRMVALVGTTPITYYYVVTATNRGRTGTTQVNSVVLTAQGLDEQFTAVGTLSIETPLPWRLGPGESAARYFAKDFVDDELKQRGKSAADLIAIASTGHGNFRSKVQRRRRSALMKALGGKNRS